MTVNPIINCPEGVLDMPALVTVACLAYNHEDYIARALESMLCQQTDFPYEILVHDDASTDRTAEILRDYETRYPGKIRGHGAYGGSAL